MPHKPYIILIGILLTLCGCDKTPVNGDLDGMWQLMTIETPDSTADVQARRLYLSFYLHLADWRCPQKNEHFHFYSHFTHRQDSLCFYDLCRASAHTAQDADDIPLTATDMALGDMDDWGIHTLDMRYRIKSLNSRNLTLEKKDTVYAFRKF